MLRTLHIFIQIIKYQFYAKLEYPGAYMLGILGQLFGYGVEILMLFLVVSNFGTLVGWYPEEVVFLFSIWLLTYAIAATFTFNLCRNFAQIVINGTIDEALIRPLPPFGYLVATHINLAYIAHISLATVTLTMSIIGLNLSWGFPEFFWLVILLISGSVITGALMLLSEMPALVTRSASPISPFFWETRTFTQYPLTIYPRGLQLVFTSIIPLGFINFYPVQVLLGRQEGIGAPLSSWLSPFVAMILVKLTQLFWKWTSRYYESAGS